MGKECCSNVSSRLWGGALRDETKNGCEGDYLSVHTPMNELSVIRYLCYTQRILGLPGGKHCQSPERNVCVKLFLRQK